MVGTLSESELAQPWDPGDGDSAEPDPTSFPRRLPPFAAFGRS